MGRTIEVDDDKVACYTADGSIHLISNKIFNAMLFMDGIKEKDEVYFKPYVRYENGSKMFSVSDSLCRCEAGLQIHRQSRSA